MASKIFPYVKTSLLKTRLFRFVVWVFFWGGLLLFKASLGTCLLISEKIMNFILLHEQITFSPIVDAAHSFDKGIVIMPSWISVIFKKVHEFAGFSVNFLHKIQPS